MIAAHLNALTEEDACATFHRCCGSIRWAQEMTAARPFVDDEMLFKRADEIWLRMRKDDILEAFTHHPQIGADKESLRAKFQHTHTWSAQEQAGVSHADEEVLDRLVVGNKAYLARFGYIFIVCATGKSAAEMCSLLEQRLPNAEDTELRIAAGEQAKITRIRLEKLI